MAQIFDLFGDPVPANWGMPGRPEHVATQQNRNTVSVLLAAGWSNKRIAAALFVTLPTLRKHYFSELKYRDVARDRLEAVLLVKCAEQVQTGNIGAVKEMQRLLDRNDLMMFGQKRPPADADAPKPEKLGKKDQALADAQTPDTGTTLGELMAQRQGHGEPPRSH